MPLVKSNTRSSFHFGVAVFVASCIFLLLPGRAHAQTRTTVFSKHYRWFNYAGDHPISGRWGLHFDSHFREQGGASWHQWLVRPGLNYQVRRGISLGVTYAYFKSYPGGATPVGSSAPEHRFHEQITIARKIGRIPLKHRVRFDQRFLGSARHDATLTRTWRTENRFRYMLRSDIPIKRAADERVQVYLGLYNEAFFRFASAGYSTFDQNRSYAGLGFGLSRWMTLEIGAFNQRLKQNTGKIENNNVMQIAIGSTMPFRHMISRLQSGLF
jgi:hypothetical protein